MDRKKTYIYIGVAWPYVNDIFHIGNLAGAYLPPDIFARFHKLSGKTVLMVSGSDMHGTPITVRAQKEGKPPSEIAKKFHELDKTHLKAFGIDYNLYTSTATQNHKEVTQDMFLALLKNGYIKTFKTQQPYSEASRTFLQDRYIQGQCPYCGNNEARGDQCEQCGRALEPSELINPRSKIDNSPLILRETQNYFLDLSKLQKEIESWIEKQREWRPWVKAEALGWTKEGLKPRAITRDLDYGIPLPVEKIATKDRIENIEKKVFYVWFEAVIGYLSAAIEYSKNKKNDEYWKNFFYNKNAQTYYFVGQDNLVFHTINWPAQLLGFDKTINLPTNVLVNKFLLLEGKKMSKSKGWFIETPYLVENYSVDALRFYIALHMPQTKELNFTWEDFISTTNNIFVGTIGNFVHRVLTFYKKEFGKEYEGGKVQSHIKESIEKTFSSTKRELEKGNIREALAEVVALATFGNQYLEQHKFWELAKQDKAKAKAKAKEVLNHALVLIYHLAVLLYPFVPEASKRLAGFLGAHSLLEIQEGQNKWGYQQVPEFSLAEQLAPLIEKIDPLKAKEEKEKLVQK